MQTRADASGITATKRLIADASGITAADILYKQKMMDHLNGRIMVVGAGVGGGFINISELHVLNYK
jgi:hypothetical protein